MSITDPGVRALKRHLRNLEKQIVEVDQRVARVVMHGKVKKGGVRKQGDDWQVQLELARDENDKPVESPWVAVQPVGAGALKIKVKPAEGERFTLLSPSGVIGSGSQAIRAPFDDDHPAPKGDEDLVLEVGNAKLLIKDGQFNIKVGDSEIELTAAAINTVSKSQHLVGKVHLGVDAKNQEAGPLVTTEAGPAKQTFAKT
ncbi:hypothetical protein HNR60_001539 [Rhodopseudomonas rhenobacensis]|uniref:Phage baseplate assembly protein V n=1 Tax=Rhodopseudomonas rhenobacensis TaxID=87461 RepID=A0A7W8DZD9_9BRAD|nr:hypothetical protein [Rhodopseudomonas rhenobacensis]MBB5046791.1 hypothetical protein [Rhodopseudomonas rhenobacensis]